MTSMSRVNVLELTSPSLTVKLTVRVKAGRIVTGVLIGDRCEGRLVVGQRVATGQRQRARRPRSRLPVIGAGIGEGQTRLHH